MAVVVAQVSLEHLDDDTEVRFEGLDVVAQFGDRFARAPELLVGAHLLAGQVPDDSRQPEQGKKRPSRATSNCRVLRRRDRNCATGAPGAKVVAVAAMGTAINWSSGPRQYNARPSARQRAYVPVRGNLPLAARRRADGAGAGDVALPILLNVLTAADNSRPKEHGRRIPKDLDGTTGARMGARR